MRYWGQRLGVAALLFAMMTPLGCEERREEREDRGRVNIDVQHPGGGTRSTSITRRTKTVGTRVLMTNRPRRSVRDDPPASGFAKLRRDKTRSGLVKKGEIASKARQATRNRHPSHLRAGRPGSPEPRLQRGGDSRPPRLRSGLVKIPAGTNAQLKIGDRAVQLTNLGKPFWPELGITKRGLLQYYADLSAVLLPHVRDRAMVMKRYPNGAAGDFFFMKRAPSPRPDWIQLCAIEHSSGNIIHFPVIQDLASLLWVVNLGCIDLNQWYARCDDVDRPDYLHFDLDPVPGAGFDEVLETARVVHEALSGLNMPAYAKTTGSRGIHVYVPIVRGPNQKQVWTFTKAVAQMLAGRRPDLITSEYRIEKRPAGRVLVDYNQNAWGRTLASVYSVRPTPRATVSAPVTWEEIDRGIAIEDFRLDNMPQRVHKLGDLWKPLLSARGRFNLERLL